MEELENIKEICVDTDILIDFLKKKEPGSGAYEQWRSKAHVGITSITAFELLRGARQLGLKEKRYDEAKSLIDQQHEVFPFDGTSADKASEISAELNRTGRGIEIRDIFNASICICRGIPLITRNKEHYRRVPSLKLIGV